MSDGQIQNFFFFGVFRGNCTFILKRLEYKFLWSNYLDDSG